MKKNSIMNLPYNFKSIDFEGQIQENLNSYHKLKYLVNRPAAELHPRAIKKDIH